MKLTINDILKVNLLETYNLNSSNSKVIKGVSIDSRTIKKNALFFAIRGKFNDGHNFLKDAVKKGAVGIIIDKRFFVKNRNLIQKKIFATVFILVVENTTKALGELANIYRKKFNIPFIAVAGSNGKTTVKDLIAKVLSEKYCVLSTIGNMNNHIGVPLTLFRLNDKHEIAVVEIGTNHFGEINYLCQILEPTHGLITNIGNEHLEFFQNTRGVAKEEGALFNYLASKNSNTVAFINVDDKRVLRLSKVVKNRILYGTYENMGEILGINHSVNGNGKFTFQLIRKFKNTRATITLPIPGKHNISNAVAAAAVGLYFKLPAGKIKKALEKFKPVDQRMEVLKAGSVTILNDTYNANADSVFSALDTLQLMKKCNKIVIVLGDMLELGKQSKQQHILVGKALTKFADKSLFPVYLFTYGEQAKHIFRTVKKVIKAHYCDKKVLCKDLVELLADNDLVLVKGSRGMKMEEIVTKITKKVSG